LKITEVRVEKLFSLEKYNNEKFGLTAQVEEGEDPDKVLAELNFKILAIEDCLEAYRRLQNDEDYVVSNIESAESNIAHCKSQIKNMTVKIEELLQQAEKGDVDARFRHACERESYKSIKERLLAEEQNLKDLNVNLKKIIAVKEELKKRIKEGKFSLENIDVPKLRRQHYY